jgi:hypothetical protein
MIVDDGDYLMSDEVIIWVDFSSDWYVRPVSSAPDADHPGADG